MFISSYQLLFRLGLGILILTLTACGATQPKEPDNPEVQRPVESLMKQDVNYAIPVDDPLEGMNRSIYVFNTKLDRNVLVPVIDVYRGYVPNFLRQGIHNFYSNLASINHTFNSALQLKGEKTVNNGLRFISNSTLGLLGILDVATGMGLPEQKEDLGQTLGYWGVGNGPYIVLPFFGPSNLRDTTGLVGDFALSDWYTDELGLNGNNGGLTAYYLFSTIDTRNNVNFRYLENGSPFEYELMRLFYTKGREVLIAK